MVDDDWENPLDIRSPSQVLGDELEEREQRRYERALKKALKQSPIRTRYQPKDRGLPGEAATTREPRSSTKESDGARRVSVASTASATQGRRRPSSAGAGGEGRAARLASAAKKMAARGGKEAAIIKAAVVGAAETSLQALDTEGADRVAGDLYSLIYPLPDEKDLKAYGVRGQAYRDEVRKKSLRGIKEGVGVARSESEFEQMKARGQFWCGAAGDPERVVANMASERTAVGGFKTMAMKDMLAEHIPAKAKHNAATARHTKSRIASGTLEEFWCSLPGDSAIRRLPEQHECVYDFGDSRISMPRFFADDMRDGDRHCEAGQLLEVKMRHGAVTMKTRAPRRTAVEGASSLDEICDVQALDSRLRAFEVQQKELETKNGTGMTGRPYSHMFIKKKPPSEKDWQMWRELQAAKRRAEMEERDALLTRKRQGNWDDLLQMQMDDHLDEAQLEFAGREQELAEYVTEQEPDAPPSPSSAVSDGRSASRSPTSAQSPWGTEASTPHGGSRTPSPAGATGQRRGQMLQGNDDTAPWDRSPEEMATPSGEANGTSRAKKELAWTLQAVRPGSSVGFQLEFSVDVAGLDQPPALLDGVGAAGCKAGEDDDEFWQGIFEPIPTGFQQPRCLGVCGC